MREKGLNNRQLLFFTEIRGESTGIRGCTCFLGRALHSSSHCSSSWAPRGSSLFTQQTVEEVSQHSLIGSSRCRRNEMVVVVVRVLVYKYTHIIHFVFPPKISLSCVIEDKSSSLPITEWCLAPIWELFIFLFKQNILQYFILKELCSYKPRKKKLFNIVNRLTLKN